MLRLVCECNSCQALDPNSDFPEKPVGSKEQQDATREYLGPAASGQGMKVLPLGSAFGNLKPTLNVSDLGSPILLCRMQQTQ